MKTDLEKKPIVVANWKMNGNKSKVINDLECYINQASVNYEEIIFALPYLYIPIAYDMVMSKIKDGINIKCNFACQDISRFVGYGAYTGEISANMLAEFGVSHVIVGHSERRTFFGDNKDVIALKLNNLLQNKITPIYCIGESLSIRQNGEYKEFLLDQLDVYAQILQGCSGSSSVIIAYEPIWSIGTGIIPEIEQIKEVMELVNGFMQKKLGHDKIATLYGGSVNASNIAEIINTHHVSGVLVGGASLNVNEFSLICSQVVKLG